MIDEPARDFQSRLERNDGATRGGRTSVRDPLNSAGRCASRSASWIINTSANLSAVKSEILDGVPEGFVTPRCPRLPFSGWLLCPW